MVRKDRNCFQLNRKLHFTQNTVLIGIFQLAKHRLSHLKHQKYSEMSSTLATIIEPIINDAVDKFGTPSLHWLQNLTLSLTIDAFMQQYKEDEVSYTKAKATLKKDFEKNLAKLLEKYAY